MKTIKLILLVSLVLAATVVRSQTYLISSGGTTTTCSGYFYDSGGSSNYTNSENYTKTFTASSGKMQVKFVMFQTEANWDYLYIYDGPTTGSAQIAGSPFHGTTIPETVTSSGSSLTFRFTSDGSNVSSGWIAYIRCVTTSAAPTVQDCRGAIPLCFQSYSTTTSYVNEGNFPNEIQNYYGANSVNNCPNNCLLDGELNDVWYTFTVQNSGTVNFTISPNSSGDDYDWAIYNLTNNTCDVIKTNPSAVQVSCNYCGLTGATGPTGADPQTCEYGDPAVCGNYNAALNVTVGQIYVVNVSNWTSSQSGYTITFGGTAQIVDNDSPDLQSITSSPACGQNQVGIRFNENIQCSTVQPGDFTITGPGGPYTCTSAYSATCASGGNYDRNFTLTISPAFTAGGTYTISLVANSVSDICNKPTGTQNLNFTVTGVSATAIVNSNVNCYGGNNGSATATGSGGTPPYTYLWSNSATTATVTGLTAGTYYVTVRDNLGLCNVVQSVTITQPSQLTSSVTKTNVSCYGGTNGSATATPSGGTPGYSYLWSNSQTGGTASGLAAGNYTITITDSRGCTTTNSANITQPSQVTVTMTSTNVSCNGGTNGSATATPSGGTPNYTYYWSTGATTSTINSLAANTYNVTVTDAAGCTRTNSVTITQPSVLNATVSNTNASCYGGSNGTLTATPSGGTPSYTYYWFPSGQTTQTATGLPAGSYNVTVTDSRGCTKVVSGAIGQPSAMTLTPSATNATCGMSNGSASVAVSGGTSPYTYHWSNNGSTSTISGIPSGNYSVTVTDNNSCTSVSSANVSNTGAPSLSVSSSTNVNCYGGNNGAASVSASGGTPAYTYQWSTGATTTSVTGLTAGTYSATVTDAIGCKATTSVVITQPTQMTSSIIGSTNPGCYGASTGNATVAASGGTPGYIYNWSNGQTNANAVNLAAGTYTVTVIDTHSCTTTSSVTLSQPSQVSANISANTPVSCFGGSNGTATVSPSGGTPGYTYLWSNGNSNASNSGLSAGTFSVTVTDVNGCTASTSVLINQPANLLATIPNAGNVSCFSGSNGQAVSNVSGGTMPYSYLWSNSATTSSITGVVAGTYTLTVTDNNLCTAIASVTITEPTQLQATTSIAANVSCPGGNNGSANVTASGGTPVYFYSWSNGSSNTTVNGLPAGTHSVTVSDANMCTTTASVVISEPSPLTVNLIPDSVNCFGSSTGSISSTPTGGTFPYTFLWSNSATGQSISNIPVGNYTVTMTDVNSCTTTESITLYQPSDLTVTPTILDAHCGLSDGSIDISCSGGTPGYSYLWDANAGSATTSLVSNILSGTYYVTITDVQNCEYVEFFSVSDIGAPQITFNSQTNNDCFGDSTGTVTASITGGISPYVVLWSTGSSALTLTDLGAGTYYITVTDDIGCQTLTSVTITQPLPISAQVTSLDSISCYGLFDGGVTVQAQGGTPSYMYHWEDSLGTTVGITGALTNIPAGHYYLTITDMNGCTGLFNGLFTQPDQLIASTLEPSSPSCNGGSNGSIVAIVTGGTPSYSFLWSNTTVNDTASNLSAGNYSYTVTDHNGCTDTYSVTVGEPPVIVLSAGSVNSTCSAANGEAFVTASGGSPGFTYSWNTGSFNDTITSLSQGIYYVTVSDSHGCTETTSVNVGSQNAGSIQVVLSTDISCYGGSDGAITVSMSGGTSPFTYTWSHNIMLNQPNATGLPADSYSVTIVDANYCITDTTLTLGEPLSALQALHATQDITCFNNNNGIISVTTSGGTGPNYSYIWSNMATTSSVSNLAPGTYSVTVSDSHNCTTVITDSINQPDEIIATSNIQNPLCNNSLNGSATVTVSGGTLPYHFYWSNGDTTFTISNVAAGQYTVTIVDNNGCPVPLITTLINPPAIQYTADYDIDLATNSGYIHVTASGGQAPYIYIWSNGSDQANLENLPGGYYTMTLTDGNGCFVIDSFYIDIPLIVPNMITPNGDLVNDDFEIQNIEAFEAVTVEIYSRWGDLLFHFDGTGFEYKDPANRWKGTYNGKDLPMGSYVYIVKIEGKDDPYTGAVSIKR